MYQITFGVAILKIMFGEIFVYSKKKGAERPFNCPFGN
tara:strand:- start:786 stop:899 length:114 start_codon:yes stop_codon:yes gene_type:complete